jgi:hypothetical protein
LHDMAYYIFLKSMRSLEEFRKNPHLKIPPKSPSTNFQSLDKFKNSIFIRKEIFFNFRANRPSGRASPPAPECPGRLSQPIRPQAARQAEPAHQVEPAPFSFLPQCAGSTAATARAAAPLATWPPLSSSPTADLLSLPGHHTA